MAEAWQEFEEAVARFLSALDAKAAVTRDVRTPDRHTGQPRQRDVWIEAKLLGHFPITALVSCKRWSEKLDVQDIDQFVGEWDSSGAPVGVIYSYSGFTGPALEKAKVLGISCCRLFDGKAPQLPESLAIPSYLIQPQVRVSYEGGLAKPEGGAATWDHLFDIQLAEDSESQTVLDAIAEAFKELESEALSKERLAGSRYPEALATRLSFYGPEGGSETIVVTVEVHWRCFRGDFSAYLVEGSYCETTDEFLGRQAFPIIDLQGRDPGPGWTCAPYPPPRSNSYMHCFRYGGDVKGALESSLRGTNIAPST